ncbi:MAG: hypothetical protein V5A72_02335, partial [Candidatus Nanohaloarchaea archaeon]
HSHGTENFTRSEATEIPEGVKEVVFRGHDEEHGYGGRAIIVKVETGEMEVYNQGVEPDPFSAESAGFNKDQGKNSSETDGTNNITVEKTEVNTDRKSPIESVIYLLKKLF